MDEVVKKTLYKRVAEEPCARKFGLKLLDLDLGFSRVEMIFTSDMENIFAKAHGGALFTLIDEAFETACNSYGTVAVALNVNVTYVMSPEPGAKLIAEARELHITRKTASYEIKVHDEEMRLIAFCQALAYRKAEPLPFLAS